MSSGRRAHRRASSVIVGHCRRIVGASSGRALVRAAAASVQRQRITARLRKGASINAIVGGCVPPPGVEIAHVIAAHARFPALRLPLVSFRRPSRGNAAARYNDPPRCVVARVDITRGSWKRSARLRVYLHVRRFAGAPLPLADRCRNLASQSCARAHGEKEAMRNS